MNHTIAGNCPYAQKYGKKELISCSTFGKILTVYITTKKYTNLAAELAVTGQFSNKLRFARLNVHLVFFKDAN